MRNHVQGVALLLVLAAAVWGTARLAAPAVDDAFGGDDDEATGPAEDVIDLSAGDDEAEMTPDEVETLQFYLTFEGYDTKGIDGIMGAGTRQAVEQAKADYELSTISDRELLTFLVARYADPVEPEPGAADPATDDTAPDDTATTEAADVG